MRRFFEDYSVGQVLRHATPRTVTEGDRALVMALYGSRHALTSSDPFARACGLRGAPLDSLAVFHIVFGKTVPDVSLNAVANLGYADGVFGAPVYPGDTLTARSEVIGLREASSGKAGVVWVRTLGENQRGEEVVRYVRWVLVRKRDPEAPAPPPQIPELIAAVPASALRVPEGLDFAGHDDLAAGGNRWDAFGTGVKIDHQDGVTVEEAEHMLATRLWQNTARVHFDATLREDGRRLVYGGHVMSLARALSYQGLEQAHLVLAINAGTHANPCFAGTTVRAWSEVLDRAPLTDSVGALRVRLVATTGAPFALTGADGKHLPEVLLDLDCWLALPR